jgi:hypothetical protein
MMYGKSAALAATLFLVLTLATPVSAGQAMSGTQIKSLFPGTFKAVVNGFVTVKLTAYRSGKLKGSMSGDSDHGRWSVRGSVLCIVLKKWMDGKSRCSRVTKSGKWYRVASVKFKRF